MSNNQSIHTIKKDLDSLHLLHGTTTCRTVGFREKENFISLNPTDRKAAASCKVVQASKCISTNKISIS
jgi:hypothetical protein